MGNTERQVIVEETDDGVRIGLVGWPAGGEVEWLDTREPVKNIDPRLWSARLPEDVVANG